VAVGEPIDLSSRRDDLEDFDAVRDMTSDLMDVLTAMTIDLRDRYPERWASRG
jgi:hypothetical protein